MTYQAISRKYRPQKFEEVIGQSHISLTLRNAIKNNRISHAYLFTGSRGIGKTSTARILAKSLNCENPVDYNPCNQCQNCTEITIGTSLDVLEIDGASNRGIDQIRDLRENVKYPPAKSNYRIFIIDEVHMLTKEAFNALLKTLEEPPQHVVFIFATTEPSKIPATIISRCQRFDFYRIPLKDIIAQLKIIAEKEKVEISDDVFSLIAKKADGSMRDAESLLDQVIAFSGDVVTIDDANKILHQIDYDYFFKVGSLILNKERSALLEMANDIFINGIDIRDFLDGLAEHFRNCMIAKTTNSVDMIDLPLNIKEKFKIESENWQLEDLLRLIQIISDAQINLKLAINQRTFLEFVLIKMGTMDSVVTLEQLLKHIDSADFNVGRKTEEPKTLDIFKPDDSNSNSTSDANPVAVKEEFPALKHQVRENHDVEEVSIGSIRRNWSSIAEQVGKSNPSLSNFLRDGLPHKLNGNVLEIAFSNQAEFHIANVSKRSTIIEDVLYKLFNNRMRIRCVKSNESTVAMPDTEALDSITKKVIDLFDGEIISR